MLAIGLEKVVCFFLNTRTELSYANHAGSNSCANSAARRWESFLGEGLPGHCQQGHDRHGPRQFDPPGNNPRVRRGLYDMPRVNPSLGGKLSPDIDEAARAIARRQRWKIVPEGAWAANLLGLSTQVPSKITYLTDGPNNEVSIGRRIIHFKHARPKALAGLEGKFALVVQALRHLGKEGVGPREIETLRAVLSPAEKRKLVRDTRFGVDWIYDVAKKIAEKAA